MKTTNIRTISINEFTSALNLTPEALFRKFSGIHFSGVNSDSPKVTLVPRGLDRQEIDLPRGSIDLISIGVHRDSGLLRLSVSGDMPTRLATQILTAIPYGDLSYDREIGHSSYGFFNRPHDGEFSHFLMSENTEEAIHLTSVKDRNLDFFEFAVDGDNLVLSALANGSFFRSVTPISAIKSGFVPSWKGIEITGNPTGYDLTTRIVDGKVGTVMGTEDGAYLYRDGEVVSYKETKGKVVVRVANFAGMLDSADVPSDIESINSLYFITREGESYKVWNSSMSPSNSLTSLKVSDEVSELIARDDVNLISAGSCAYIGTPSNWSVIQANRAVA